MSTKKTTNVNNAQGQETVIPPSDEKITVAMDNANNAVNNDLTARIAELEKENKAFVEAEKAREEEEKAKAEAAAADLAQGIHMDKMAALQISGQKKVKIIIGSDDASGNTGVVPVSVNGHAFLIARDVEVEVPISALKVLQKYAKTKRPVKGPDGKIIGYKDVQRFSVSVVG